LRYGVVAVTIITIVSFDINSCVAGRTSGLWKTVFK